MGSHGQDLFEFFLFLFINCVVNHITNSLLFIIFFSDVFFMLIDKVCGITFIVHIISVIIWLNKVERV